MKKNVTAPKETPATRSRVVNGIGIVFCVILSVILIVNCTLLVKSFINEDEVPSFAGIVPMMVFTESMSPQIEAGDIIFCQVVDPEDIKEGDVISFFDPEGNGTTVVTHKVKSVNRENGKLTFTTYGINNLDAEGEYDIDTFPVPAEDLVGRYTDFRLPLLGHVAMFMQSTWGLILCIALPLAAFVAYEVVRRRKYEENRSGDIATLMAELEALKAEKAAKPSPAEDSSEKNDSSADGE